MIAGDLERLIQLLARLPGLGPRSARRAVLHLMKKREALMLPLAEAMARAAETVTVCSTCGNLDTRRSEEHTSELQSLMRISYAVFYLKKKNDSKNDTTNTHNDNLIIK